MKVTGIVSGDPSRGFGQPGRENDSPRSCFSFCVFACMFQGFSDLFNNTPSFEISFQTTVL